MRRREAIRRLARVCAAPLIGLTLSRGRAFARDGIRSSTARDMTSWVVLRGVPAAFDLDDLRQTLKEVFHGEFLPARDRSFVVDRPIMMAFDAHARTRLAAGVAAGLSNGRAYPMWTQPYPGLTRPVTHVALPIRATSPQIPPLDADGTATHSLQCERRSRLFIE